MDICEYCNNYIYDEDEENYICVADFDEDDMARFVSSKYKECPYFRNADEYKIVRKQM